MLDLANGRRTQVSILRLWIDCDWESFDDLALFGYIDEELSSLVDLLRNDLLFDDWSLVFDILFLMIFYQFFNNMSSSFYFRRENIMFLYELYEYFQSIETLQTSGWLVDPFMLAFSDLFFNEIYEDINQLDP